MALKLSLKPGEQFVINGAVVTNGDRRTVLVVQNKASILRDRDVMTEAEATTPAKRVYFACMVAYLDPDAADAAYQHFVETMDGFMAAVENPRVRLTCAQVSFAMMNGEYYRALAGCRDLIDYEALVLGDGDVAERLQKRA
jgi:flagellar biosynthesis repressor protein FlbT